MTKKELASSFDKVSKEYDKYRSGYPEIVFNSILEQFKNRENLKALEIGAGSGQATIDFVNRDVLVKAIEPSENLFKIASKKFSKNKNINFINKSFEDYSEEEIDTNFFDIVFAAQSFHWLNKEKAFKNISRVLKKNGVFTAFWKREFPSTHSLNLKLSKIYEKHIPNFKALSLKEYEELTLKDLTELVKSEYFYASKLLRFSLPKTQTKVDDYINGIKSWSMLANLIKLDREKCLEEIREVIDSNGKIVQSGQREIVLIIGKSIK